jgi:hypothetical protein
MLGERSPQHAHTQKNTPDIALPIQTKLFKIFNKPFNSVSIASLILLDLRCPFKTLLTAEALTSNLRATRAGTPRNATIICPGVLGRSLGIPKILGHVSRPSS